MSQSYIYIPGLTYTSRGPIHIDAIRLTATDKLGGSLTTYYKISKTEELSGSVIYSSTKLTNQYIGSSATSGDDIPQYSRLNSDFTYPYRVEYGHFLDTITSAEDQTKKYNHVIGYGLDSVQCQIHSHNQDKNYHDGIFVIKLDNINTDVYLHFTLYSRLSRSQGSLWAGDLYNSTNFNPSDTELFSNGFIIVGEHDVIYNPITSGSGSGGSFSPLGEKVSQYYDIEKQSDSSYTFELPLAAGLLVGSSDDINTVHEKQTYYQYTYKADKKKHELDKNLECNRASYFTDKNLGEYYNSFYSSYGSISPISINNIELDSATRHSAKRVMYDWSGNLVDNRSELTTSNKRKEEFWLSGAHNKNVGLKTRNIILHDVSLHKYYRLTNCSLDKFNYLYSTQPRVTIKNLSFKSGFSDNVGGMGIGSRLVGTLALSQRFSNFCNTNIQQYTTVLDNVLETAVGEQLNSSGAANEYTYKWTQANGSYVSSVRSTSIYQTPIQYRLFSSQLSLWWNSLNTRFRTSYKYGEGSANNNAGIFSDLYQGFETLPGFKSDMNISINNDQIAKSNSFSDPQMYYPGKYPRLWFSYRGKAEYYSEEDYYRGTKGNQDIDFDSNSNSDLRQNMASLMDYTYLPLVKNNVNAVNQDYNEDANSLFWNWFPIFESAKSISNELVVSENSLLDATYPSRSIPIPLDQNPILDISLNINSLYIPIYYCVDIDKELNESTLKSQCLNDISNGYLTPKFLISQQFVIDLHDRSSITYSNKGDFSINPIVCDSAYGYLNNKELPINIKLTNNLLCEQGYDSITKINSTVSNALKTPINLGFRSTFCNDKRFLEVKKSTPITINKQVSLASKTLYVLTVHSDTDNLLFSAQIQEIEHLLLSNSSLILLYNNSSTSQNITLTSINPISSQTDTSKYIGSIGLYEVDTTGETIRDYQIKAELAEINKLTGTLYASSINDNLTNILRNTLITLPSSFCAKEDLVFLQDITLSQNRDQYDSKLNSAFGVKNVSVQEVYNFKYLPEKAYYKIDGFYKLSNSQYIQKGELELTSNSGFENVESVQLKIGQIKIKE